MVPFVVLLSRVHAKAFRHRLGDARYTDEVLFDELVGAGAVGDGSLRKSERVDRCNSKTEYTSSEVFSELFVCIHTCLSHKNQDSFHPSASVRTLMFTSSPL